MEVLQFLFFGMFALVIVISALGAIFCRNIIHSIVSLVITFLSVSGIFILLNADFLAISQIIIYAVGITILLVFSLMFTTTKDDNKLWLAFAPRTILAFVVAGTLFILLMFNITNKFTDFNINPKSFITKAPKESTIELLKKQGTTPIIGKQLLTKYVLPFEILSILLLGVIIGAAVIAKKDTNEKNRASESA